MNELEAVKQELAILQAEIETLRSRKSMISCIRETFAQARPVPILKRKACRNGVEVTILETDFERLIQQARSAAWIEQKISELKRIGDRLWIELNQKEMLQAAIQRAEEAEIQCRRLENELFQRSQPVQDFCLEDEAEREIDYPDWDGREID